MIARRFIPFLVFFGVCLGLGYASLNRVDLGAVGISDSAQYRQMVRGDYADVPAPFRYRVLVPSLGGLFYRATSGLSFGSWNREMLALLLTNAVLMSLAAIVLMEIARTIEVPSGALGVLPLLYLSSFAVANVHLVGLVDSAEALVICLTIWLTLTRRWKWIPAVLCLGALGKETAFILAASYGLAVLIWSRARGVTADRGPWIAWSLGVVLGALVLVLVRLGVGPDPAGVEIFSMRRLVSLPAGLVQALGSKTWIYTFAVIAPLGMLRLNRLPAAVVFGSVVMALVGLLGASYARIADNVSRPLFNTLGPALCIASSILLSELIAQWAGRRKGARSS